MYRRWFQRSVTSPRRRGPTVCWRNTSVSGVPRTDLRTGSCNHPRSSSPPSQFTLKRSPGSYFFLFFFSAFIFTSLYLLYIYFSRFLFSLSLSVALSFSNLLPFDHIDFKMLEFLVLVRFSLYLVSSINKEEDWFLYRGNNTRNTRISYFQCCSLLANSYFKRNRWTIIRCYFKERKHTQDVYFYEENKQ